MNIAGSRLSLGATLIFLIAIAIFIYMFVKDNKNTDKEDRTFTDNAWIGIFFFVLIVGLIISSMSCYNYNYEQTHQRNFNYGKLIRDKFQEPDFIGIPHFR